MSVWGHVVQFCFSLICFGGMWSRQLIFSNLKHVIFRWSIVLGPVTSTADTEEVNLSLWIITEWVTAEFSFHSNRLVEPSGRSQVIREIWLTWVNYLQHYLISFSELHFSSGSSSGRLVSHLLVQAYLMADWTLCGDSVAGCHLEKQKVTLGNVMICWPPTTEIIGSKTSSGS